MAQKVQKSITHWTKKHAEFCLKNKLPTAAKLLWEWLIENGKVGRESEPDLKDFNKWIEKSRGRGYCNKTLKKAFNKLVECRVVNLLKKYTWNIVKITTRPLEYLKARKKVRKRDLISKLEASKARKYEDGFLQQQHIKIIDNQLLFSKYGILFDAEEKEVLDRPRNEILLAITCYQIADETRVECAGEVKVSKGKIANPPGWIRACLRKRYWEKPHTYEMILAKYGHTTFFDELFPDG